MEHLSDTSFLGKLLVFLANVRLDWKVIASYRHSSFFGLIISDEGKKFYNIVTKSFARSSFMLMCWVKFLTLVISQWHIWKFWKNCSINAKKYWHFLQLSAFSELRYTSLKFSKRQKFDQMSQRSWVKFFMLVISQWNILKLQKRVFKSCQNLYWHFLQLSAFSELRYMWLRYIERQKLDQ